MITTDRLLVSAGEVSVMGSQEAMDIYYQRLANFDDELRTARETPVPFAMELLTLTRMAVRSLLDGEIDPEHPQLAQLAVTRVVGETVSAVYGTATSRTWIWASMSDFPKSRVNFIAGSKIEDLLSNKSEVSADLERFFF